MLRLVAGKLPNTIASNYNKIFYWEVKILGTLNWPISFKTEQQTLQWDDC